MILNTTFHRNFPYVGRVQSQPPPENSGPMIPHGYMTLAQLVSGTPSASSLYQNPIWSSNAMPTSGPFIPNVISHIHVQTAFTLVSIQLTIPTLPLPTYVSSSIPPLSGKNVSPPHSQHGGEFPNIPLVSSGTHVSESQPHMVEVSQPISGIPNPTESSILARASNVQYQQHYSA